MSLFTQRILLSIQLGDAACRALGKALRRNGRLKSLSLEQNANVNDCVLLMRVIRPCLHVSCMLLFISVTGAKGVGLANHYAPFHTSCASCMVLLI